jgi:mannose-6-phosphate isomerase
VDQLLQAPASEWVAAYQNGALSKSDPAFWAARAVLSFCRSGSMDRGIFSIFLFNLLKLESGQGIYQGAGVPHAYLEGHAVEIMSNSDNVLRGGLTPKHIDVAELLRHIHTEFIEPQIIQPRPDTTGLRTYPVPVDDFKIRSISLGVGEAVQYRSDDSLILLLPEGELELESGSDRLRLGAPDLCAYLSPQTPFSVRALRPSLLFIASGRSGSPD